MSSECERLFSSAKKLITPEKDHLNAQIIEVSECLKNWWDNGLIVQQDYALGDVDLDDFEPQDDEDDDSQL
jgi:hypothetical protein